MKNKYYIYFHINPLTNKVFYVGKGHKNRAYQKRSRNQYWKNTVAKYGYIIDIIDHNLTNEEAGIKEIFYIKFFGRNNLVNMTDGGEGCVNPSQITKDKISKTLTGKVQSNETKEKRSKTSKITWSNPILKELKSKQSSELNRLGIIGTKGKSSKKKGRVFEGDKKKLSNSLKKYYETHKPHNFIEIDDNIKNKIFNDYTNGLNKFKLHKKYNLCRTVIERLIKEYGNRT